MINLLESVLNKVAMNEYTIKVQDKRREALIHLVKFNKLNTEKAMIKTQGTEKKDLGKKKKQDKDQ